MWENINLSDEEKLGLTVTSKEKYIESIIIKRAIHVYKFQKKTIVNVNVILDLEKKHVHAILW